MNSRLARRPRRQGASAAPLAHLEWRNLQHRFAPVDALTPDELTLLHEASMNILEDIGMAFMDDEALDLWQQAGAHVDRSSQMVKIDRGLLMGLLQHAPSEFVWRARNPQYNIYIGGKHLIFSPHGGTIFVSGLNVKRRPGVMEDYVEFLKIVQSCNLLHVTGEQLIVPHDIDVSFRHLQRLKAAIHYTDKPIMEATHGRVIANDNVEMMKLVFGEDITQSDQPVLGGIVNSGSPLRWDDRMCGGIIAYARANQVLIVTPFILAGAVAPITMAAAVAQQNAEALAGIALAQLVRPGAPCIYGGFATPIDMRSGNPAFGMPEGAWATLASAQMARHYGLPYRSSGTLNTSKVPDAQSMLETMWSTFPAMNAHANFLQHATGWLEGGLTVNKEKIMIDIENLAMLQKYLEPVQINADTLALEYIAKVGAGGHHFETAHTQARYSTEYYSPILGDRQNHETWEKGGAQDMAARASKVYEAVLEHYEAPALDESISEAVSAYVDKRQRELAGVNLYY